VKTSAIIIPIGRKFGDWTVTGDAGSVSNHKSWNCVCKCGFASVIRGTVLRSGQSLSCIDCANKEKASLPDSKHVEIPIGAKFGNWTVIGNAKRIKAQRCWKCVCTCGFKAYVRGSALRYGKTASCKRCTGITRIVARYGTKAGSHA